MSDKALIEQTLAGDKKAFEQLYEQYVRLVRAVCFDATGDFAAAQDLAQEVFLRAYSKLSTIKNKDAFGAWVTGIARLAGKEWRRKKGRDRHEFADTLPETLADPEPDQDERIYCMRKAMLELPENERLALHAFYLCGQSATEARKTLELSQSGFYKLLDRAREHLGRAIKANQG